jgi:ABC-type multidrug transport system ATPase subunit
MACGFQGGNEGRISDINLKVRVGERVALMGYDNSGRAMLLRVLAGLRPVREGNLTILGHKVEPLPYYADWDQIVPRSLRRRIGCCLEVEGLLSNVSVREGLETLFRFKYGDHNEKLREGAMKIVSAICERFALGDAVDKRPFLLTSAERRLAGLARAFLSKPKLVVLENPSQNIGDSSRDRLWSALEYISSQPGRTLVISTDDWAVASHFCTRWIVMDNGTIAFDGDPRDFLKQGHPMVQQFKDIIKSHKSYEKLFEEVA